MRVTLGVDADTHEAIVTGHHGSKFGLPPEQAEIILADALARRIAVLGLHVHVGSQLPDFVAQAETIRRLAAFAAACRELARVGSPRRESRRGLRNQASPRRRGAGRRRARGHGRGDSTRPPSRDEGLPEPMIWLEPGRCLVGRAGVTLYRVGSVKRLDGRTWVAVDGGMSDNPRPQLYDARYTALSALRRRRGAGRARQRGRPCTASRETSSSTTSSLPSPRRGDLLAIPATGAYTLAMSSNYNGVDRPAAVLVRHGEAQLIRRRETIDDLLALEAGYVGSQPTSTTYPSGSRNFTLT